MTTILIYMNRACTCWCLWRKTQADGSYCCALMGTHLSLLSRGFEVSCCALQDVNAPGMHEDDSFNNIVDPRDKQPRLTGIVHQWCFKFGEQVTEGAVVVSFRSTLCAQSCDTLFMCVSLYMYMCACVCA